MLSPCASVKALEAPIGGQASSVGQLLGSLELLCGALSEEEGTASEMEDSVLKTEVVAAPDDKDAV